MALARYWRIKNITVTGTQLEIADFQFGYTSVAVTGGTLSSNIAPTTGSLSAFSDGNPSNVCSWPVADLATLTIAWDFGAPVEITQIRQAMNSTIDRQIDRCTMESSANGTSWSTVDVDRGVPQTDAANTYGTWMMFTEATPIPVFAVSGTVLNAAGNPLNAMIAVYNRATGALIARLDSDIANGNWVCATPNADPVLVVRFNAPVISQADPFIYAPGAPEGNAEVYDNVIPIEVVGGGGGAPA